jgi:hypothetical protein
MVVSALLLGLVVLALALPFAPFIASGWLLKNCWKSLSVWWGEEFRRGLRFIFPNVPALAQTGRDKTLTEE